MSRIIFRYGQNVAAGTRVQLLTRSLPPVVTKCSELPCQGVRGLYSESALGIYKLDRVREQKEHLFVGSSKERYLERLKQYVSDGDSKSVFKDDLINLLGIAETEEHLDLIEQIVIGSSTGKDNSFEGWGTTLMRLYYKMNQLDRALRNVKDVERFGDFFNQQSSYKILMTMLYNAKRYDKVVELFEDAEGKFGQVDRHLSLLTFAAFAKINGEQAMDRAEKLYSRIADNTGLRSAALIAYMAVKNKRPKYALNLISNLPGKHYITIRELKVKSLIQLERYEDILLQLREYIEKSRRDTSVLLQSTHDIIMETLDKIEDGAVRQEINDILVEIKDGGHLSDTPIEELLFKEVVYDPSTARPKFESRGDYRGDYRNDSRRDFRGNSRSNYRDDSRNESRYDSNNRSRGRYNNSREQGGDERSPKSFSYQKMNFN